MDNENEQHYFWQEKLANQHLRLGLSSHGQSEVGKVSFVDLPNRLAQIKKGDSIVSVEGSKAVTELAAPIDGAVIEFNQDLEEHPEKLNSQDHQENWIVEIALTN